MNVADSDTIHQLLSQRGFVLTDSPHDADLIVVNTCSVRENAEKRAKARIAEFARIKSRRKGQLWVIGCMAQRIGDHLKEEIPGVDRVIGAKQMEQIEAVVDSIVTSTEASNSVFQRNTVTDFVAVMRGCNNYCAYCIVPYVRGAEQSIPYEIIEQSVREKVAGGIKEITFLGQNVNSYSSNDLDFPDMLARITAVEGLERIRFTTSHPKDCTEKLIDTMATHPKLCSHIHLPVQAGNDRILSLMNRKYDSAHYRKLLDMIKKKLPHADITTDILVGFPGESDAEFRDTLSLVKDARFTTAFMFAYSPREGTKAALMKEEVPEEQKQQRLSELISLQTEITRELYEESVGRELEVLVSGKQEKREQAWMGQDRGCRRVLIACQGIEAGMILKVKAVRSSGMTLIGERIS